MDTPTVMALCKWQIDKSDRTINEISHIYIYTYTTNGSTRVTIYVIIELLYEIAVASQHIIYGMITP